MSKKVLIITSLLIAIMVLPGSNWVFDDLYIGEKNVLQNAIIDRPTLLMKEFWSHEQGRANNTLNEDFEDTVDPRTWSFHSGSSNGTNERSDVDGYGGSGHCWRMDAKGGDGDLNELVLHVGLDASYNDTGLNNLTLVFAARVYGAWEQMPASFDGCGNFDGVAVSSDGERWARAWSPANPARGSWLDPAGDIEVNITAILPGLCSAGKAYRDDLYIKFQQFGNGAIDTEGTLWDDISLDADQEVEFDLRVPGLSLDVDIDPEGPFCIYAAGQGDQDEASLSIGIRGMEGYGNTRSGGIVDDDSEVPGAARSGRARDDLPETAAEMVRITYEPTPGLIVKDAGGDIVDGIEWSSANVNPDDDAVFVGDEFEITFNVTSGYGFAGSIGSIRVQYFTWDGDEVDTPLPVPELLVKELDHVELRGNITANNNDPGSVIELVSYDNQQPRGEMPPQEFMGWRTEYLGDYTMFDTITDPATGQLYSNRRTFRLYDGEVGDTGMIFATHKPTGMEFEFPVTLINGSVSKAAITADKYYRVGKTEVITVALEDDYGNACTQWCGKMYVEVLEGEVDFDDDFEVDGEGEYYTFTEGDRGQHSFIMTPLTHHLNGPTLISFRTAGGLADNVSLDVMEGPVRHLDVELDWECMGWSGPNESYYAGEPLYVKVRGMDEQDKPSDVYNAPIIVTHDAPGDDEYEPQPWQDEVGDVALTLENGVTTNYPDDPLKFFQAGKINIYFRSKMNHTIGGNLSLEVRPTYLVELVSDPAGTESDPVLVWAGQSRLFTIRGFDEYGNEVTLAGENWSVDENVNTIGGGTNMTIPGDYRAVEYIAGESREGGVHVNAIGPRSHIVYLHIPVLVGNDKDVWISAEEIEPDQMLAGNELTLQVPINYNIPHEAIGRDTYEMTIRFTLTDDAGYEIAVLYENNVLLTGLNSQSYGVEIFTTTIPWEAFGEYVKVSGAGNKIANHIRAEIADALGGPDMRDFERNAENNVAVTDLYVVSIHGSGDDDQLTYVDSDGDGMDDGWEEYHFGGNADPEADPDGDGLSNLEEYEKGSDPTESDETNSGGGMGTVRVVLMILGAVAIMAIAAIAIVILMVKRQKGPEAGTSETRYDTDRTLPGEGGVSDEQEGAHPGVPGPDGRDLY